MKRDQTVGAVKSGQEDAFVIGAKFWPQEHAYDKRFGFTRDKALDRCDIQTMHCGGHCATVAQTVPRESADAAILVPACYALAAALGTA